MDKPKDMLEFLRRSSGDPAPTPPPAKLEPTTRVVVLRRSQLVVGMVCAGLALALAFLLGLALGGDGEEAVGEATYYIKAVEYRDTSQGRQVAESVKGQLEQIQPRLPVLVLRDRDDETVKVVVGGWRADPAELPEARTILAKIQGIKDRRTGEAPFAGASFWRRR